MKINNMILATAALVFFCWPIAGVIWGTAGAAWTVAIACSIFGLFLAAVVMRLTRGL